MFEEFGKSFENQQRGGTEGRGCCGDASQQIVDRMLLLRLGSSTRLQLSCCTLALAFSAAMGAAALWLWLCALIALKKVYCCT